MSDRNILDYPLSSCPGHCVRVEEANEQFFSLFLTLKGVWGYVQLGSALHLLPFMSMHVCVTWIPLSLLRVKTVYTASC